MRRWCRRRFRFKIAQLLDVVRRRMDAPLDAVPIGMLTPEAVNLIWGSPAMQRLLVLHEYLMRRLVR